MRDVEGNWRSVPAGIVDVENKSRDRFWFEGSKFGPAGGGVISPEWLKM